MPKLVGLNLQGSYLPPASLDELATLPLLRELNLSSAPWVHDEHVARLASLPKLEFLNLSNTPVTSDVFVALAKFPAIGFVTLTQCSRIDDTSVEAIIQFCQGRQVRLNLSGTEMTLSGLKRLRAAVPGVQLDFRAETMLGLRSVGQRGQFVSNPYGDIIGFRSFRDAEGVIHELQPGDLAVVSALPDLKRINLDQTFLTDEIFQELSFMPQLEHLRLSTTLISDQSLERLSNVPNLTILTLLSADIDGDGLKHIRQLRKLETLRFQARQGDAVISHITELPNLINLSLQAPITNASAETLSKIRTLRWLELLETRIRGKGIERLADLPALNELVIIGGDLDDSDLDSFKKLPHIRTIGLHGTKVTREAANKLVKSIPGLAVNWTDSD